MLIELYETTYGICDHLNTINPLASVQFHKAEQYLNNYLYDGYLSTYVYRELGKKLGLSFDEFINRPKYEIEAMIRVIEEVDDRRLKASEGTLKELEKTVLKPPSS